jgi:hypothetical protein
LWSNHIKNDNRMITFLIQWEKFSFEFSINFSAVTDELPEQVRSETPYLFRMIEHEWKNCKTCLMRIVAPHQKLHVITDQISSLLHLSLLFCIFRQLSNFSSNFLHWKFLSFFQDDFVTFIWENTEREWWGVSLKLLPLLP